MRNPDLAVGMFPQLSSWRYKVCTSYAINELQVSSLFQAMNDEIREFAPSQQLIEIAEEFVQRVRDQESPTVQEYLDRYPEQASEINRYLPMLLPSSSASPTTLHENLLIPIDSLPTGINRYHVRRLVGSGSMGAVYFAQDLELDRPVAFKIPQIPHAHSIERFYREARAMATVTHPHICSVFDVGEIKDEDIDAAELKELVGRPYMTMAYIEGDDLSELMSKPWDPRVAAELIRKVASGLHLAHEAGVVHRDVKPGNIMIDHDGEPILTDFGLARRDVPEEVELTIDGQIIGSPAYMSPEQINCHRDLGPAADIYSLGVTFFELVSGQRPFSGSPLTLLRDICWKSPPSPKQFREDIDADVEAICMRAIEKDPTKRYESAAELAEDLQAYLEGHPVSAPRRRSKYLKALPWLVLAGCLLLAAFAWNQTNSGSARAVSQSTTAKNDPMPVPTVSADEFTTQLHDIFLKHFRQRSHRRRMPDMSSAYSDAFAKYGIIPDVTSPKSLESFLATQSDEMRNEILIGLESWFACLQRKTEDVPAPWLRSLLEANNKDHTPIRRALLEGNADSALHQVEIYQIAQHDPRLVVIWSQYLKNIGAKIDKQLLFAAEEVYPSDAWVNMAVGIRKKSNKNYVGAIDSFKRAMEAENSVEAKTHMAVAHLKRKEYEDAAAFAQMAIDAEPDFGGPYFFLGKAQFNLEDYSSALTSFEAAIERDSCYFGQAHALYARTLLHVDRHEDSMTAARKAISLYKERDFLGNIVTISTALVKQLEANNEYGFVEERYEFVSAALKAAKSRWQIKKLRPSVDSLIELLEADDTRDNGPRIAKLKRALAQAYRSTANWQKRTISPKALKR